MEDDPPRKVSPQAVYLEVLRGFDGVNLNEDTSVHSTCDESCHDDLGIALEEVFELKSRDDGSLRHTLFRPRLARH